MIVEIDSAEDPFDFYKGINSEPKEGEVLGRIGFISTTLIAFGAALPAAFKKKRTYSIPNGFDNAAPPQEIIIEEPPIENGPIVLPQCTEVEKEKIRELFTAIANGGANLIWDGLRLHRLGNEIEHVHPFALFLAMPKGEMKQILASGNPLKINSFTNGVKKGIERELGRNKIYKYIPRLAAAMNKEPEPLKRLIQGGEWLALVQYLFDTPARHAE